MSDSVTPMDCSPQAPLSMGIPRQALERVAIGSIGDHPDPWIEPASPSLQADSLPLSHLGSLLQATVDIYCLPPLSFVLDSPHPRPPT